MKKLWEQYNVIDETMRTALPEVWADQPLQVDLYLDCTNEIVIIANIVDAYMSWVSRTSTAEQEINKRIIKHIITAPVELFADGYHNPFWKKVGIENYQKAKLGLYKVTLKQEGDIWRSTENKVYFGTPEEQAEHIIADIITLFDTLRAKCRETEDDAFVQKLKVYDAEIKACHKKFSTEKYEENIFGIQNALNENTYHCLSENTEIREWFYQLRVECLSLWQTYRSIIA